MRNALDDVSSKCFADLVLAALLKAMALKYSAGLFLRYNGMILYFI